MPKKSIIISYVLFILSVLLALYANGDIGGGGQSELLFLITILMSLIYCVYSIIALVRIIVLIKNKNCSPIYIFFITMPLLIPLIFYLVNLAFF